MLLLLAASAFADVAYCAPGAVEYLWPEANAVDVPTNAVPFAIASPCPDEGGDVVGSLKDDAGVELATVTVTLKAGGYSDLVTVAPGPLTAGAHYDFGVSSRANEVESGFTVGTAEAEALTEGPSLTLSEVTVEGEGGGNANVTVAAPAGALAIAVFGNSGDREYLMSAADATSYALGLQVLVAPDEEFCATASALDATGTWTDGGEVCTTAKSGYTSICGVTGASSVSMLGLGIGGLLVGRRRGR